MAQAVSKIAKSTPAPSRYRYERKFVLEETTKTEALWQIKHHPALFREVFPERTVNNIYYDTYDLKNFHDNVIGSAERLKARIRWYGDLHSESVSANLEIKRKSGLLGEKQSWPISDFSLTLGLDQQRLRERINQTAISEPLRMNMAQLQPALINRYTRRYFLSANGLFRITLDFGMEYFRPHSASEKMTDNQRLILELKYDQQDDQFVNEISSFFPFRLTKSSKFVSGLSLLNQWSV